MGRSQDDGARQRAANHLQFAVQQLDRLADGAGPNGHELLSVKFKMDADDGLSVLCILVSQKDGQEFVSFVGAPDLESCWLGLYKRLKAGRLNWRKSIPWGERDE